MVSNGASGSPRFEITNLALLKSSSFVKIEGVAKIFSSALFADSRPLKESSIAMQD